MQALDTPRRIKRKQPHTETAEVARHLSPANYPVHEAVRPLLVELAYLRLRDKPPPGDVLFDHARSQLNRLRTKLEELGMPPEDVRDIYYALVAFIDEAMQADQGPLKDFWQAHLLQLELFGETRAGEGFFERLAEARDERRLAVLRVYYLCLLFGFQGVYAQHGEFERENLIAELRSVLGIQAVMEKALAPFGPRPDEPAADRERNRLLQRLAVGAAILAVVWYGGIAFTLDARARVLGGALSQAAAALVAGTGATASN